MPSHQYREDSPQVRQSSPGDALEGAEAPSRSMLGSESYAVLPKRVQTSCRMPAMTTAVPSAKTARRTSMLRER